MEEGSLVRRSCRLQQRHQEQRGFAFPADLMNDGDGNGETMQQKGRLRRAVDTAGPDLGTGLWQGPRAGSFGAATDEALLQDLEDQECDVDGDRMQGGTAGLGPGGAGAARGASAGRSSGRGSGSSELAAVGRRCRAPSRCATEQGQDRCSARACSRQQREVLQAASAAAPRRLGSAAREEAGQGPGGPEEGVSGSLGDGDQDEEDLPVKDSLDSFIVGTLEAEEGDEGDEEEGDGEGALPSPGVDPCFEDAEDVRLWYMLDLVHEQLPDAFLGDGSSSQEGVLQMEVNMKEARRLINQALEHERARMESSSWVNAFTKLGLRRALERYPEIWFDEEGSDASGDEGLYEGEEQGGEPTKCTVCNRHRHKRRLHKVVLRGAPLDVSSFWDGGILEAEAKSAAGGCPTEFYAGGVCLTRVLGYHDVLHFKTRLAAELRTTLERALRDRGFSLEDDAVPPEVQAKAWEDVSFGDAHKGWREKQCRSIKRLVGTVNGPGRIPRVAAGQAVRTQRVPSVRQDGGARRRARRREEKREGEGRAGEAEGEGKGEQLEDSEAEERESREQAGGGEQQGGVGGRRGAEGEGGEGQGGSGEAGRGGGVDSDDDGWVARGYGARGGRDPKRRRSVFVDNSQECEVGEGPGGGGCAEGGSGGGAAATTALAVEGGWVAVGCGSGSGDAAAGGMSRRPPPSRVDWADGGGHGDGFGGGGQQGVWQSGAGAVVGQAVVRAAGCGAAAGMRGSSGGGGGGWSGGMGQAPNMCAGQTVSAATTPGQQQHSQRQHLPAYHPPRDPQQQQHLLLPPACQQQPHLQQGQADHHPQQQHGPVRHQQQLLYHTYEQQQHNNQQQVPSHRQQQLQPQQQQPSSFHHHRQIQQHQPHLKEGDVPYGDGGAAGGSGGVAAAEVPRSLALAEDQGWAAVGSCSSSGGAAAASRGTSRRPPPSGVNMADGGGGGAQQGIWQGGASTAAWAAWSAAWQGAPGSGAAAGVRGGSGDGGGGWSGGVGLAPYPYPDQARSATTTPGQQQHTQHLPFGGGHGDGDQQGMRQGGARANAWQAVGMPGSGGAAAGMHCGSGGGGGGGRRSYGMNLTPNPYPDQARFATATPGQQQHSQHLPYGCGHGDGDQRGMWQGGARAGAWQGAPGSGAAGMHCGSGGGGGGMGLAPYPYADQTVSAAVMPGPQPHQQHKQQHFNQPTNQRQPQVLQPAYQQYYYHHPQHQPGPAARDEQHMHHPQYYLQQQQQHSGEHSYQQHQQEAPCHQQQQRQQCQRNTCLPEGGNAAAIGARPGEGGGGGQRGEGALGEAGLQATHADRHPLSRPRAGACFFCGEAGHWGCDCPHKHQPCSLCKAKGHHRSKCPKRGRPCNICGQEGHWADACPTQRGQNT